jgi:hypothetical protein
MFKFFKRLSSPQREFVVLARCRTGDWMKQFTIEARDAYEAARLFDQYDCFADWVRVSGATIK